LQHPGIKDGFWQGLGQVVDLPSSFIFLHDEPGLFVLEPVQQYYGIHAAIYPEKRGLEAVKFAKNAFVWMFKHTKAEKVLARIDRKRPDVIAFARMAGMKKFSETNETVFYEVAKCH